MKVSIVICWKKCSLLLQDCTQDYKSTGGEKPPGATFDSEQSGTKVAKKPL